MPQYFCHHDLDSMDSFSKLKTHLKREIFASLPLLLLLLLLCYAQRSRCGINEMGVSVFAVSQPRRRSALAEYLSGGRPIEGADDTMTSSARHVRAEAAACKYLQNCRRKQRETDRTKCQHQICDETPS